MATLTGTGSNLVVEGTLSSLFGSTLGLSFLTWFLFSFPLVIVNMFILWIVLHILFIWAPEYFPKFGALLSPGSSPNVRKKRSHGSANRQSGLSLHDSNTFDRDITTVPEHDSEVASSQQVINFQHNDEFKIDDTGTINVLTEIELKEIEFDNPLQRRSGGFAAVEVEQDEIETEDKNFGNDKNQVKLTYPGVVVVSENCSKRWIIMRLLCCYFDSLYMLLCKCR